MQLSQEQQVTVGFKVTGLQKREIEAAARRMEVDVSTYLRSLTLGGHEKITRFQKVPDALVIQSERVGEGIELLKRLLAHYPGYSCSDLILASLHAALQNEQRIVSLKIKNYLP